MKLRSLPAKTSLKGKRIFVRVDWNVPLTGDLDPGDSLKIVRSLQTIQSLADRGATVVVATHLGRPKKREADLSTKHLLPTLGIHFGLHVHFLKNDLNKKAEAESAKKQIQQAPAGTIFLLENVRFFEGEESCSVVLAKAYASLADIFVNDAFASCHRAHASVVGIAKQLPAYAGTSLLAEVEACAKLLGKPKRPYVAFMGGAKISTKLEAIEKLLPHVDRLYIGGAMANVFLSANGHEVGMSYQEKGMSKIVKKLLKEPKIVLPRDVIVAKRLDEKAKPRIALIDEVHVTEMIGDIGPATIRAWSADIKKAKTILWNGPFGVTEVPAFSHGSIALGRVMAARSHGKCFGVAGGGDTIPVVMRTGMGEWLDHVSTGGGALLDFISLNGKLPGLQSLQS